MRRYVFIFLAMLTAGFTPSETNGQDLLGDTIPLTNTFLHLKPYVDLSGQGKLISMTTQPSNTGNNNLFVTTQSGQVFSVADTGNATGSASLWFDYNSAIQSIIPNANNGFVLDSVTNPHGGLRAIAFHPDFATNGKFYTSAMVDRPTGITGLNYLGSSVSGFDAESVVAEWTVDPLTGQLAANPYRELFRVQMPVFDHPVKQIAFNPYAQPGDEDYGLLYVAHGDGSVHSAIAGGGQNRDDALGKILRINPLADGSQPYTTPGNPFVEIPTHWTKSTPWGIATRTTFPLPRSRRVRRSRSSPRPGETISRKSTY